MTLEIWTLYCATVLALMSTPGPSQLLMLSNSATHGFHNALATAAGDLTANALQMLAAGLGLAAIIAASGAALTVMKWAGVLYLIWLGLRMILSATYIVMDAMFLSVYGAGAGWVASRFKGTARVWIERTGGSFMILAAVLLGLKSVAQR